MYNATRIFMSQILYINILVDWSLSGIMTSKLVIRESELTKITILFTYILLDSDFTNDEFLGHYPILIHSNLQIGLPSTISIFW